MYSMEITVQVTSLQGRDDWKPPAGPPVRGEKLPHAPAAEKKGF